MTVLSDRLDTLTSWRADWTGLRVAVLGLGATGFSVADTLAELGSDVLVVAESAPDEYARLLPVIGARLDETSLDDIPSSLVDFAPEVVVASPGFPPTHPVIEWVRAQGIALWGDIELAWRVRDKVVRDDGRPAEWLLVTGTNGKTTTTRLAATMLVEGGLRAAPCGNIGVPVLDAVRDPAGFDVLVVELSSHQLWYLGLDDGVGALVPHSSVCLNLADDHLAWHGSAAAYRDAKAIVYRHTKVACVYNKADEQTMRMVEEAEVTEGARAIGFDLGVPGPSDLGIVDGILADRAFVENRRTSAAELATVEELRERGLAMPHIVANILAAAALARAVGIEPSAVRRALADFELDPHRMQLVAHADGVAWVDDSKATNPHAAIASLTAFPQAVWIVGGLFKGIDIGDLVRERGGSVTAAIAIGVDRDPVREAFARHAPHVPLYEVDDAQTEGVMARAVELAARAVGADGVVLLAPAAASFDQFASYGERGDRFQDAVRERIERGSSDDSDGSAPEAG
ncbi:UDP-N-acetylmuramoyl-L-alanine--D-glutamate ligase [Microbacterium suaedae]|uniref:UDP-N-acetylmuramoyl-L-alanine--D-glutamate ligase n=1 Tax=Microbacterium suaedae TaxID=2067813 RepID=UPI001E410929|nr:UDP-N-acetylmuramoyl-L-alanine--D-glutamate ligase [Microbacterium suaedae]